MGASSRFAVVALATFASSAMACSQEGVVGSLKTAPPAPDAPTGPTASDAAISAGGASTCVRSSVGDVRCWGENGTGSLGIGDQIPEESEKPLEPLKLGQVSALFAGEKSHCAIRPDGKVFCWGTIAVAFEQGAGQISAMTPLPVVTPFSIDSVTGPVLRVAIGRHFMCTLGAEGEVRCFGLNQKGQLGLGSTDSQHLPTTVNGLDGAATTVSASMGGLFVCATTSSGAVYCWGDNTSGQIGDGAPSAVLAPRRIDGLSERAVEVVSGGSHACARLESGKVACWGEGKDGQLGDGRSTASPTPVLAEALTDVVGLAAGDAHTCAVRSEGSVFCWGSDAEGQSGSIPNSKHPWIVVASTFKARAVSCGLAHSCAWGDGGRVQCWGSDARLQLGPKTATF